MLKLGVNIDHIATVRQARRGLTPDPIAAIKICEAAGADSIVCHLREDRRHIQDQDVWAIRKAVKTRMNLEMALSGEIIALASVIRPDVATIVPEKREEITTEGGLDVKKNFLKIKKTISFLQGAGIDVSLFIAPDTQQIDLSLASGAKIIEIHTGCYSEARSEQMQKKELNKIIAAAKYAKSLGLMVSAGHGLDYTNTRAIAKIKVIEELNIGHSIVSEALFIGLEQSVKKMLTIMSKARGGK